MKFNRLIFSLLVIFTLTLSVATIYAETASVGSLSFEVPNGLTVESSDGNEITFKNTNGEKIMINSKLGDDSVVGAYLQSLGYSYDSSMNVNTTNYNPNGGVTASYSYTSAQFSGNDGYAIVYSFEKDGTPYAIIGFTKNINNSPTSMGDEVDGMKELLNEIMK